MLATMATMACLYRHYGLPDCYAHGIAALHNSAPDALRHGYDVTATSCSLDALPCAQPGAVVAAS